jgi:Zn-dependent peptidase ImmA (M78 family)
MAGRKQLARQALEAALQVRRDEKVSLWAPVDVYDLAERMKVRVVFVSASSLEGMYRKGKRPTIVISALRPAGRQAYTCAHELGHHVFQHGSILVDEFKNATTKPNEQDPQEILADLFAGFLLMPKSAVERAFTVRSWNLQSCMPLQIYTIANWFGIGYTTLLSHMANTLRLLSPTQARALEKIPLSKIREEYLNRATPENLVIADEQWSERSIDVHVGDLIQLPAGVHHAGNVVHLQEVNQHGHLFYAAHQGIGRFSHPITGWAASVRVSQKQYIGLAQYRHLEDPDDD